MNASSASGLWPILTVGIRGLVDSEAQSELTGADRADDRVPAARGVDLDPRPTEVHGPVRVVGRDLRERDLRGLVERPALARVGHLDRVQGDATGADPPDALERLGDGQLVARRMVQDVERLALADDLADVLIEPRPVELDAVKQEELRREPGECLPVALVDPVLVIRDGEEIVAERLVFGDELGGLPDAVGEGRVGVKVTAEPGHPTQGAGAGRRAGGGPSQVIEKPSAKTPLLSLHPECGEPTGVVGDTHPATPKRPLEVGVSRRLDSGPMNAGSCCTWPPRG